MIRLLDTNTCIYFLNKASDRITQQFKKFSPSCQCVDLTADAPVSSPIIPDHFPYTMRTNLPWALRCQAFNFQDSAIDVGFFTLTNSDLSIRIMVTLYHMTPTLRFRVIHERNAMKSMEMSFLLCPLYKAPCRVVSNRRTAP